MAPKKSKTELPQIVLQAIKCGPVPVIRNIEGLPIDELTTGEKVIRFAEKYLIAPDGILEGQPIRLEPFQKAFLLAVLDNPHGTRYATFSVGRRNGKSLLLAILIIAAICGPIAKRGSGIAAAAMTKEQGGILYRLASTMVRSSPQVNALCRCVDSGKRIIGLQSRVTFTAIAREAKSGLGQSYRLIVLDEAGQIEAPDDAFLGMLRSSQGSYTDPLMVNISTQASSDGAYLSKQIDGAIADQPKNTVVHLYTSPDEADILDETGLAMSNPGILGGFRSLEGLKADLQKAVAFPEGLSRDLNLYLNRRVSQSKTIVVPSMWRELGGDIPTGVWSDGRRVAMGLDLSLRFDLTSCVLSTILDDGRTAFKPMVFVPSEGLAERSRRDAAPCDGWSKMMMPDGSPVVFAIESSVMDYNRISRAIQAELDRIDCTPDIVCFDSWSITEFKASCEFTGVRFAQEAEWTDVRQGSKSMSPRLEHFRGLVAERRLIHPGNGAFTSAVLGATIVENETGAAVAQKTKSTTRIDALIAGLMSCYAVREEAPQAVGSYLDDGEGLMMIW